MSFHHLLLLSNEKKLICLSALSGEIDLIGEKILEIDHALINQHASDATSIVLAKVCFDYGIDGVTDELLSVLRVCDDFKVCKIDLRKC